MENIALFIFVNGICKFAAAKCLGYKAPELVGCTSTQVAKKLLPTELQAPTLKKYRAREKRALSDPERKIDEMEIVCKNGETRRFVVLSTHIRNQLYLMTILMAMEWHRQAKRNIRRLLDKIVAEHVWLGFESVEDFEFDAIRQKVEFFLSLPP